MAYLPQRTVTTSISADDRDAFGRARVSEPITVWSSKQIFGNGLFDALYLNYTEGSGSTTYDADLASYLLTVSSSGDVAIRQTRRYFNYSPGRSHLCMVTSSAESGDISNLCHRAGLFDDDNGIFFESEDGNYSFVLRSSTSGILTERRVAQANWNLDTLDGNGDSGFNLDATKGNIYVIDMQWLGVGDVRVGVGNEGVITWAHRFRNENVYGAPYMPTPNLPVRWEARANDNLANPVAVNSICSTVLSEGGDEPQQVVRSIDGGLTASSIGSTRTPLIAVRTSGIYKTLSLEPLAINVGLAANATVLIETFVGGTITNATWSETEDGVVQYSQSFDYAPSGVGAIKIDSFHIFATTRQSSSTIRSLVLTGLEAYGADASQPIVVMGTKTGGGTVSAYGSIKIREVL